MLRSADRHYAQTAAIATRAVREARRGDAGTVVVRHQAAAASTATLAVTAMLAEQDTPVEPDALLLPLSFTTAPENVAAMLEQVETDWQFNRLVASLVTDAARSAEQATITTRERVGFVRYVSPPCCSRCAILAGRFYRFSDGFDRHPGCDCTHLPTTDPRSDFRQDPLDLVERGLVNDLSKADQRALADGADFGQIVNIRRREAGLTRSGRVLRRGSRPTPEAIYARVGDDRDAAIQQRIRCGYLRA